MSSPVGAGMAGAGPGQRTIAVVIGVILVVALVGIAVTVVLVTKGGSSPSGTVSNYLDAVERKDIGGVFNATIWDLNQSLYGDWNDIIELPNTNYQITIHSLAEIPRGDYTPEQIHEMNDSIETIEGLFDVVVQDYAIVTANYTYTATHDGESETSNITADIPLVKIAGNWLIVMLLDDLKDILQNHEPSTLACTLAGSTITGGRKITVLSITQTNVPWQDMRIGLSDGTNFVTWNPNSADLGGGMVMTMNYSTRSLGPINVCCKVTDLAGNGAINGGDYFTLFTFGGAPTFASATTYAVSLVYLPTGGTMATLAFTG